MTNRGDGMSADLAFAVFIDMTLEAYAASPAFRSQLHSEAPGQAGVRPRNVCPPEHPHEGTSHCYTNHACRCQPCRDAASRRQKAGRMRRAHQQWKQKNQTKGKTA